jgi:hypothetical protein
VSPLGTAATVWPIVPGPDDGWWWLWSNRWKENWQEKQKFSEKTRPTLFCPPQIPHDLTRAQTRFAELGSRQLTAWAMARPSCLSVTHLKLNVLRCGP